MIKLFSGTFFPVRFFIIAFIFFLFSCTRKPVEIPKSVLPKDQLIPVLVDIHVAQAAMGMNQLVDTSHFTMSEYTSYIFTIHHITKNEYDSSMSFYSQHPELLSEIYQEVINELSKKQGEAERK